MVCQLSLDCLTKLFRPVGRDDTRGWIVKPMHELGRYLLREIDRRDWKVSDLVVRSGLSKQTIYNLVNDSRDFMDQTPQRKTVHGLAQALGVAEVDVLIASAKAIGVPFGDLPEREGLESRSNDELLAEIGRRLADRVPASVTN